GRGSDFLGWRISRAGNTEIVYEDGAAHRMVWRVASTDPDESSMAEAMQLAVLADRVVPTLIDELKKRAIAVERIAV
ncbi:MAG: hypothetical protein ABIV25_15560, partial [Paracoccaceae bacterium]